MDAVKLAYYILSLDKGNESDITPMKLQKLLYFVHGYHLAFLGKPLVTGGFSALVKGPVNYSTYQEFRGCGANIIRERKDPRLKLDPKTEAVIRDVFVVYNQFSAEKLSQLTHLVGAPWHKFYSGHSAKTPIPDDAIGEYFASQKEQFIEALEDVEDLQHVDEYERNKASIETISIEDL